MMTPDLRELLNSQGAVFADEDSQIASFGDPRHELVLAETDVALFVLSDLIRIRLSGVDRVKFLHNFCTANVKAMATGDVFEAFLTDVKARILGHGYVAAFEDCVEVWMLPGSADAVVSHLQKYVIVEDVNVEALPSTTVLALAGPHALSHYASWQQGFELEAGRCVEAESFSAICVQWGGRSLLLVSLNSSQQATGAWRALNPVGSKGAGQVAFDALRIAERFPKITVDLSNSNMAPEAGRNETAICYTKGCYLGQEPIARLDAMGHVNRQLYSGTIQLYTDDIPDGAEKWPLVTSVAKLDDDLTYALAVLPVKSMVADKPVACRTGDGRFWQFVASAVEAE
ncbi:MAG: hypothetical protein ABJZ55_23040 [Fuerstiella sp.]